MGDEHRPKTKLFPGKRGEPTSSRRQEHPHPFEPLRPLNSYEAKPSSMSQYLIDEHAEKPVQFAGEIDGVSPHLDITNRTDVLRIIDKGKKQGVIPVDVTHDSHESFAILSLSVFNIKISKYNDLILRIPMHEIAAICYIKDDQQHILAIKFGTTESCKLAVLYCENKPAAEEICALVGHCFNLVYTEATVYLLERQLNPVERPPSTSSGTASTIVQNRPLISYQSPSMHDHPLVPSDSESTRNSDSGTGKELLEDYMQKLQTKLNAEELRKFLQHLNGWKKDNFDEFCGEVLLLLGPERKQLLSELLPFIPADNYQYFEEFLRRHDIRLLENSSTLSSSQTNLRNDIRHSLSDMSTTSSVSNNATSGDALDHLLETVDIQYHSVDVNMDPRTYVPSEDYDLHI